MSETLTEQERIALRRKRLLEKAKRYRDKKKLEHIKQGGPTGNWRFSVSSLTKKDHNCSRIHLYQWFMDQSQINNSTIQSKINSYGPFQEKYIIVFSKTTKKPVARWKCDTRTIDTYDCQKLNQEIKELFEQWLKEDPDFYNAITSDESFTSQFKIAQRAIKKEKAETQ